MSCRTCVVVKQMQSNPIHCGLGTEYDITQYRSWSSLVQVMAWCQLGNKPLFELMITPHGTT